MGGRVGECVFLSAEPLVLVGIDDRRAGELADLEAQQIDLAGPRALVASERRERGIDLGESGTCGAQRFEVGGAETVECIALRGRREQALVGVLAVEVDGPRPQLGQRRRRRQATVDVGPRSTVGRDHPRHDVLVVADHEPAFDPCLGRARADDRRIGATADQQVDRLDQHRLAGTGLAGERGQTRAAARDRASR